MRALQAPIRLFALAAVAACPPQALADQPNLGSDPWKLVHPDAKWILGVDWVRARNSPAAQILSRQFQGARGRLEASGLGLDAVTSIERLIASGISLDMKDRETAGGLVVAIEGRIDRARLKQSLPAGTAVERFRGADLFVPPGARPGDPLIALHGTRWMLLGDRDSLAQVLAGKGGPKNTALYSRAAKLAAEAEIWLAVAELAPARDQASLPASLGSLRGMDLLVSLQRALHLEASLIAQSPEEARNMTGILQFASTMGNERAAGLLKHLVIGARDNRVSVTLNIPSAELEDAIQQARMAALGLGRRALESARAGIQRGLPPDLQSSPRSESAAGIRSQPASPPTVRTIRIVGLEEGTKEIHYTAPSGSHP